VSDSVLERVTRGELVTSVLFVPVAEFVWDSHKDLVGVTVFDKLSELEIDGVAVAVEAVNVSEAVAVADGKRGHTISCGLPRE
jgi:hypothetical protein